MKSVILIGVVLAAFTALPAQDGKSAYIGTVQVKLGMPQRVVLAELSRSYRAVQDSDDTWFVWTRDGNSLVGSVQFKRSELVGVSNNLYSRLAGDPEIPEVIIRLIGEFTRDNSICSVTVKKTDSGADRASALLVFCGGDRHLKVTSVVPANGRRGVIVSEESGD
jgi:hypothetical protein